MSSLSCNSDYLRISMPCRRSFLSSSFLYLSSSNSFLHSLKSLTAYSSLTLKSSHSTFDFLNCSSNSSTTTLFVVYSEICLYEAYLYSSWSRSLSSLTARRSLSQLCTRDRIFSRSSSKRLLCASSAVKAKCSESRSFLRVVNNRFGGAASGAFKSLDLS